MKLLRWFSLVIVAAATITAPTTATAAVKSCATEFPHAEIFSSNIPSRITPISGTPLPQEGVWQDTKIKVAGQTAIKTTRLRFDRAHGSKYGTLIWLDPRLVSFRQIPGKTIPKKGLGPGRVPTELKPCYVAAFTGGFLMKDSEGGAQYGSTTIGTMKNNIATLVTYTDGSIDVITWPNVNPNKTVAELRQNLPLIVENGVSKVPAGEPHNSWGWVWNGTGKNKNDVMRTGVGIRPDGTILWVMGANLNATNLANLLIRGGAVRAMALDMNKGFANGFLYGPYHTLTKPGGIIDPNITQWPARFWNPAQRDFVAIFSRS